MNYSSNQESAVSDETRWSHTKSMLGNHRIRLGPYFSYQLLHTPRRVLYALSYHKFAAKFIGPKQRILEIGCSEGLGTLVLGEFAEYCLGIDIDGEAIQVAQENYSQLSQIEFRQANIIGSSLGSFDSVVSFDVIEHIRPEDENCYLKSIVSHLKSDGICIIGTPSLQSNQFASPVTQSGHINLYSAERLHQVLSTYFKRVVIFSANDETIHTGFYQIAHYFLGIGIGLK